MKEFKDRGSLMLAVLDWVLEEHLAGRQPNDDDVAKHFNMTLEETIKLHKELEEMREV